MSDEEIIFLNNQKGKETLILGASRYNLNIKNKTGSTLWRCVNRSECSASVTINQDRHTVLRSSQHTCAIEPKKVEVFNAMVALKKDVCEDLGSVQSLYEKHTDTLKASSSNYINVKPDFKNVEDGLYKLRKRHLQSNKISFSELRDVPKILASDFLLCDDGTEENILIFCSSTARKFIENKNSVFYLGDGTFATAPSPFYQVFTLQLDLGSKYKTNNVVHVIYGLLPNNSQITYLRFFELLTTRLTIHMKTFKCDFELAIINAVRQVFPEVQIKECLFHYQKAITKKAEQLGLNDIIACKKVLRYIRNMPLLPEHLIKDGWLAILNTAPDCEQFKMLKTYFEKQLILKISPVLLSCSGDKHRTTNLLEGWHRRLAVKIPKNPNLCNFLFKIRKESVRYDYKMKNSLFYSIQKNRRKSDIAFDRKYTKYVKSLHENQITPLQLIKKNTHISTFATFLDSRRK